MRLIKLTQLPHPDVDGGRGGPIFINSDSIISIERCRVGYEMEGRIEQYRQTLSSLHNEVMRVSAQLERINIDFERPEDSTKDVMDARECASALKSAYALLQHTASIGLTHPRVDCTCVNLLGNSVCLKVFVTETPEQVASMRTWAVTAGLIALPILARVGFVAVTALALLVFFGWGADHHGAEVRGRCVRVVRRHRHGAGTVKGQEVHVWPKITWLMNRNGPCSITGSTLIAGRFHSMTLWRSGESRRKLPRNYPGRDAMGSSKDSGMITALASLAAFPQRTDWFRILADLERAGVSNRQAAFSIQRDPATLYRWKMGDSEPGHSDGQKLLHLHANVCRTNSGVAELQPQSA
jgi:hypothetical protein